MNLLDLTKTPPFVFRDNGEDLVNRLPFFGKEFAGFI
jgi:hypothetical protein